jgi:hypothetical protein
MSKHLSPTRPRLRRTLPTMPTMSSEVSRGSARDGRERPCKRKSTSAGHRREFWRGGAASAMPPTCRSPALRTSTSAGSTRQLLCFLRGQAVPKRAPRSKHWQSVGTMVAAGTCCGMGCQTHASETRSKGMALSGRPLLPHEKWERHVRKETGFRQNPRCPRDTDGRCLRRTMEGGTTYRNSKLRRITSALRHRYVGQLIEEQTPGNTQGHVANVLYRNFRDLHRGRDHAFPISDEPSFISNCAARSHGTIVVL